ncbi:MAG: PAS domain S-box protein [Bdellovibrionales bacterium]
MTTLQELFLIENERENFFRLFQKMPEVVCLLQGPEHIFEFVNQAHVRMLGFDATGKKVREAQPESAQFLEILDRVYTTGQAAHLRETPVTLGDQARYFNLVCVPRSEQQLQRLGLLVLAIEVTEQVHVREQQKENEQRLKILFTSAAAGMAVTDLNGRFIQVNPAYCTLTGYSEDELLTKTFPEITAPEQRESNFQDVHELIRGGAWGKVLEIQYVRKTGERIWVQVTVSIIRSEEGQPERIVAVCTDISERKKNEREGQKRLREIESKSTLIETVLQQIPAAVIIGEAPSGRLIFANRQIESVWRHPMRDSQTIDDYQHWVAYHSDGRRYKGEDWPLARAIAKGEVITNEDTLIVRGDGSQGVLTISAAPVRNAEGEIVAGVVICQDITENKKTISYLELLSRAGTIFAQARDFRTLLRSVASISIPALCDWICIDYVDERGNAERLDVAHAKPEKQEWCFKLKELSPWTSTTITDVIRNPRPVLLNDFPEIELSAQAKLFKATDPTARELTSRLGLKSFIVVPILARGKVRGCISFCMGDSERRYDASDLKFARDLVQRLSLAFENILLIEEAQKASQLKSAFLANMSHEIRTPLGAILGFTDLMRDPYLDETERASYLNVISRNGEQLTAIINDILDLSKIEAGQITIETLETSPRAIVEEALSLLSVRAKNKDIELTAKVADSVPQQIGTDPTRLKQIVFNIVGNAIKFTHQGGVSVEVTYAQNSNRLNSLIIEVSDTGIGIPVDQQSHLFQPFSQADESMTRRFGGTGLGLSLSKRLAQALGGHVRLVKSSPETGSIFRIEIEDRILNSISQKGAQRFDLQKGVEIDLSNVKVLLVEDAIDNQNLVRRILSRKNAHLSVASNGIEGIEKASQEDFDIILMDVQMPIMDGYTATQKLRAQGYQKPIIALTAHAMHEVHHRCMEVGCTDYISKPINAKNLIEKVAWHTRQI